MSINEARLYRVTTRADRLRHRGRTYKDVPLSFFVENRPQRLFGEGGALGVGYREVIIGYDERDDCKYCSEEAVEELFTEAEADAEQGSRGLQHPFRKRALLGSFCPPDH